MKSFKKAREAGFSLIELLLVIGFISGALVLAFVTFPKVQASNRANVEGQHIVLISTGIKSLYTTAQNFGTLSNTMLINAKVIPDDLQVATPVISNVWGGTVTIAPTATNLMYTITYTGVPRSECVKLGTSVAVNFLKLDIQGVSIFDRTGTGGSVNLDPALVAGTCADGQVNTMVFTSAN